MTDALAAPRAVLDRMLRSLDRGGRPLVVVASVQHTGTWFLVHLLRQHSMLTSFAEFADLQHPDTASHPMPSVVQFHLTGAGFRSRGDLDGVEGMLGDLATRGVGIAIPVRDPVLSLLTRRRRHPDLDHSFIVDGFRRISILPYVMPVSFLPVGIDADCVEFFGKLGIALGGDDLKRVVGVSKARPVINSSGMDDVTREYLEGRVGPVIEALPREMDRLFAMREIVVPFLKNLGFGEQPWWSA